MMWKLKSELLSNKEKTPQKKKRTRTHKMQLKKTLHHSSVCVFTCVRVFVWAVCVDYVTSNPKKKRGREVEIS